MLGSKFPKKDRFGIYIKIENNCLELIDLIISAAFESKSGKVPILSMARTKTEILKHLIRITNDLKIIEFKKYTNLELNLEEISKMINGWIKYLNT